MRATQLQALKLDEFDIKILRELGKNARISVADLSDKIGLSKTPCHNRLQRLLERGYIKGYTVLLDPAKLNLSHVAFVEVKLSSTRASALKEFNAAVMEHPEIEQCHMVKVRCSDITEYREFLGETLATLPHVQTTSTHVSMEAVKDQTVLD